MTLTRMMKITHQIKVEEGDRLRRSQWKCQMSHQDHKGGCWTVVVTAMSSSNQEKHINSIYPLHCIIILMSFYTPAQPNVCCYNYVVLVGRGWQCFETAVVGNLQNKALLTLLALRWCGRSLKVFVKYPAHCNKVIVISGFILIPYCISTVTLTYIIAFIA